MKVVVAAQHGGPETLRLEERPDPVPGPGEAGVRVEAHRALEGRRTIGKVMLSV